MPETERSAIAKAISSKVNKPAEYTINFNRLRRLAARGFPEVDLRVQQAFKDVVQRSDARSWGDMVSKWENFANIISDAKKGIIQYSRTGANSFGQKVHLIIPSLSPSEHFAIADRLFSELTRLSEEIGGGMAFKFMKGSVNLRMSNNQFGKDFTIYFTDMAAYERALPKLKEIGNTLFHYRPEIEEVQLGAVRGGVVPPNFSGSNMSKELYVAPYITMSIRAHHGNVMYISTQDAIQLAQKLDLKSAGQTLANLPVQNGYIMIDDAFLRNSSTKEVNTLLAEAYQNGLLGVFPK